MLPNVHSQRPGLASRGASRTRSRQGKRGTAGTPSLSASTGMMSVGIMRQLTTPASSTMAIDDRKITEYDVWPANNPLRRAQSQNSHRPRPPPTLRDSEASAPKPQLLLKLESIITDGLTAVTFNHPEFTQMNTVVNPREREDYYRSEIVRSGVEDLTSDDRVSWHQHLAGDAEPDGLFSEFGPEEQFRLARYRVFRQAAIAFAAGFSTYRSILLWIVDEFEGYVFMAEDWTRRQRAEMRALRNELLEEVERARRDEGAAKEQYTATQQLLSEAEERINVVLAEKAAVERELLEKAESSAAFNALIKKEQDEKDIMSRLALKYERELEEMCEKMKQPDRIIADMQKQATRRFELINQLKEHHGRTLVENADLKRELNMLRRDMLANAPRTNRHVKKLEKELAEATTRVAELAELAAQQRGTIARLHEEKVTVKAFQNGDIDERLALFIPSADSPQMQIAEATKLIEKLTEETHAQEAKLLDLCKEIGVAPESLSGTAVYANPSVVRFGEDVVHHMVRKWFVAYGEDETVPVFLRAVGRVRNKRFSKSTTEKLIRHFWDETSGGNSIIKGTAEPMPERFRQWTIAKFGYDDAMNAAYSFFHACHWFSYDPDCSLFASILVGETDESVWEQQLLLVEGLRSRLKKHAKIVEGVAMIGVKQASNLIMRSFTTWEDDTVGKIVDSFLGEFGEKDRIAVDDIFDEDAHGNQTAVVEFVRQFQLEDRKVFIRDLELSLLESSGFTTGIVTPQMVGNAVMSVDPDRPIPVMDQFLSSVFGAECPPSAVKEEADKEDFRVRYNNCTAQLPAIELLSRLRRSAVTRYTRRSRAARISSLKVLGGR